MAQPISSPASPSVAIVILNWNGQSFLEKFLPSVLNTAYHSLQVIVADNASTDDSMAWLERVHSTVKIIRLEKNYGYAGGYNRALKQVEADYYVLLNSDVEVTPGWIQPMVDALQANPKIGACQPKILAWHHKQQFEYAGASGGWIDRFGFPFARGRVFDVCEADEGQYNEPSACFWASGAALLIRADLYQQLGGFDDRFFAHQEEIDLCWRVQASGFQVACIPQSVVYHVGGGTLPQGNSLKTYLNFRNNLQMLIKNLPFSEAWYIIPMRFGLDALAAWRALLGGDAGFFGAVIKAHLYIVRHIFSIPRSSVRPPTRSLQGCHRGSIVWDFFVQKRRKFSQIVGNKSVF